MVITFFSRLRYLMEWHSNPARKGMRKHATMYLRRSVCYFLGVFPLVWKPYPLIDISLCHAYSYLLSSVTGNLLFFFSFQIETEKSTLAILIFYYSNSFPSIHLFFPSLSLSLSLSLFPSPSYWSSAGFLLPSLRDESERLFRKLFLIFSPWVQLHLLRPFPKIGRNGFVRICILRASNPFAFPTPMSLEYYRSRGQRVRYF